MTAKQQPWLISYEYRKVTGTACAIDISDVPPWKFLVQQKRDGEVITAIFWAVQVPAGGLTAEELELLS